VIATGFGESATTTRIVPAAAPTEAADDLHGRDSAPDGRPIRRLGLHEVDEYELDVPTWQRRQSATAQAERSAGSRHTPGNGVDDDPDFDVPTFLRRGAE